MYLLTGGGGGQTAPRVPFPLGAVLRVRRRSSPEPADDPPHQCMPT